MLDSAINSAHGAQPTPQIELWNESECSTRLSVLGIQRSCRTLQRGRKGEADCPKHVKIGGRYFYRADHVAAWASRKLSGANL